MNDGGPAYPYPSTEIYEPGMSLRDHFAGQALEGIVDGPAWKQGVQQMLTEASCIATACYIVADAMLAERKKET